MRRYVVECDADLVLLLRLGIGRKQIHHASGVARVAERLERSQNCVGVVDEDPGKLRPRYLSSLTSAGRDDRHGLELLRDGRRNNFVVVLCPRLEEWLLRAAEECGIDVGIFTLPGHGEELHRLLSGKRGGREKRGAMRRYEEFIEALRSSGSGRLAQLRKALFTPERWRPGGSP